MTLYLVDMDGTIVDWGAGYDWYLDNMWSDSVTYRIPRSKDQKGFDLTAGLNDDDKRIVQKAMDNMSYFGLVPIPGAIAALKSMLEEGHDVRLVTSPWLTNEKCITDKFKWVEQHLGSDWLERVIITKDKTHVAGDYLIDDKPNITGSAKPSWEQIIFDQPYNQDNTVLNRMTRWSEWKLFVPAKTVGGEVRSVSSTGGEKGVKDQRFDLLPVGALTKIAEHYGVGAKKYADNQWRKGYEWSKSYAALQRHANQFWNGEDFDAETGSNHMAAVGWHALTLLTFFDEFPEFDDRFKK